MRVMVNGKRIPVLWFFFLAWNSFDIIPEIRKHSWFWMAADIAVGAFCAYMVVRDWPKPEKPKALDRTKDLRDIWKGKDE